MKTNSSTTVYTGIDYANVCPASDSLGMVFEKRKGSESNIYYRDIAGTNEIALTYDSSENICVRGAVSGDSVVYSSNKSGIFRIYKMSLKDTKPVELLNDPEFDCVDAAFSKNGKFIVFSAISRSKTNVSQICSITPDGSSLSVLTSTDTLKRKPTVSASNDKVMFQKKVDNHWGLYYVDLSKDDKVESEFLYESSLDSFDPEFLCSGAQTVSGAEEVIFVHGQAGNSVRIDRAYFLTKTYTVIRALSSSYYYNQPAVTPDGSTVLYMQKPSNASRFDIWKTSLNGYLPLQITF